MQPNQDLLKRIQCIYALHNCKIRLKMWAEKSDNGYGDIHENKNNRKI